ncbi:MAG: YicC family protein [Oscillospiraceae bacterium]|nr:YicC family protein [Oscillospiraceae bacterium]
MVYSMTGYGKGNAVLNGKDITVEIKSVNHRYFEYSSRMSRFFSFLDDKIKKQINESVSRGKVEVSLLIKSVENSDTVVEADVNLEKSYYDALCKISGELGLPMTEDLNAISRYEGVLTQNKSEEDADQLAADVKTVVALALDEFIKMKTVEGQKLYDDVMQRLCTIEDIVTEIETIAPLRTQKYQDRLYQKLQTILQDTQIDSQRILTEAAIFADKVAVDEETVRLRSHIAQYRDILNGEARQGRKLDFLTQELNRETNTIGSKSNDLEVTRKVVEIKSEIEKIREQIQNME